MNNEIASTEGTEKTQAEKDLELVESIKNLSEEEFEAKMEAKRVETEKYMEEWFNKQPRAIRRRIGRDATFGKMLAKKLQTLRKA